MQSMRILEKPIDIPVQFEELTTNSPELKEFVLKPIENLGLYCPNCSKKLSSSNGRATIKCEN